jgi:integrase
MAGISAKRVFGELEKRTNARSGKVTGWRARYVGPDTQRHPKTFGDKMAAEAWLNVERILIDRGEWKPPKAREREERLAQQRAITVAEWAERSVANKKLRPSTRSRYERALKQRILPELGQIPLADLSRLDVANWYTRLAATASAEAKLRKENGCKGNNDGRGVLFSAYQVLSSILNDAVDHELLDASPAKVKRGLQYEAIHEPVVLTPDQMWHMTELLPNYLQALVPLAVATGLRNGELRALRRRHLDLADGSRAVVKVRGTAANNKQAGRYNEIGPPKTKKSVRDVPIPSFVVPILKEHLEKYAGPGSDGMVFPAKRGGVLHASVVERNWSVARGKVGLDDLHIHDLRHTALTWAARAGATLKELMAIAGHAHPTIVLRYQHVGDEERRHAIAERVGAAFQDELADRRARKAQDDAGAEAAGRA